LFTFLLPDYKDSKGKETPVSLMEHIYGSTNFLDQPRKCSQDNFDDKWFCIEKEVSHKKP